MFVVEEKWKIFLKNMHFQIFNSCIVDCSVEKTNSEGMNCIFYRFKAPARKQSFRNPAFSNIKFFNIKLFF